MTLNEPLAIDLQSVCKAWGPRDARSPVLAGVSLQVPRGRVVSLVGPNASGKSTLLHIIAGLERADAGQVNVSLSRTGVIPLVFQDYRASLLPWCTVEANLQYPLRLAGVPADQAKARLQRLTERFRFSVNRQAPVFTLSGGEAQTCCLLRALVVEPEVLLLDEPLSALDYEARLEVRQRIAEITDVLIPPPTIVIVSHDLDDALFLADEVVFLTRRPMTNSERLMVPLPRPRSLGIETTHEFTALKKEAIRAFERCIARR